MKAYQLDRMKDLPLPELYLPSYRSINIHASRIWKELLQSHSSLLDMTFRHHFGRLGFVPMGGFISPILPFAAWMLQGSIQICSAHRELGPTQLPCHFTRVTTLR
jgi:hypothetical protein